MNDLPVWLYLATLIAVESPRLRRGALMLPFAIVANLLLLMNAPAAAMVVVHRDFPQLVARAEQIVTGTVVDVSEKLDASGAPATFVTLTDLDVLKGDVGTTLTLRLYGGRIGDRAVYVADMPRFTIGDRDVLFIAGNGRDVCPLVGVWQGRFRVRRDAARGLEVVEDDAHRPVTGITGRELQRAPAAAGLQQPSPLTLDDFRQLIAEELAHPQP